LKVKMKARAGQERAQLACALEPILLELLGEEKWQKVEEKICEATSVLLQQQNKLGITPKITMEVEKADDGRHHIKYDFWEIGKKIAENIQPPLKSLMENQVSWLHERSLILWNGVPRPGYHVEDRRWKFHFSPWAGCLTACMAFLGEEYSYHHIVGTSGMGFRLLWNSSEWDPGNVGDLHMGSAEPYRRVFESVGYAHELLYNGAHFGDAVDFLGPSRDREAFRSRIVASIRDAGHPAIAWGVVGPPEGCVLAGYDEGGEVLIGWSFFQDRPPEFPEQDFEPSGYFRKRDWFKHTLGLVLIGDKQEKPPLSEIYRGVLEWALQVVRTPIAHKHYNGLRAYEGWAEFMRRDEGIRDDRRR
jgi:hypothetical protein